MFFEGGRWTEIRWQITGITDPEDEQTKVYVNPPMVTNTLWLREVPKCEILRLPPPFHTGTPHMVMGTVFLAIHLVTHQSISFLPKRADFVVHTKQT
jgi:hypothetical protein